MQLSALSWLTFFLLSIVMGLNNVYSTLLTGWGDGGSIVAVILCLMFLVKEQRTIINYNLGQTMASAGGSVGFTVAIVAGIYYLRDRTGDPWTPPLFDLSVLIMSLSLMGVALAAPLRNYVIRWFFPSAVACATILRAVTSKNYQERRKARRTMGISGFLSAIATPPTKVAISPGSPAMLNKFTIWTQKLSISPDPLLYGIGIVIGPRIGCSMLLGGLINTFSLTPALEASGLDISEYLRWIAVGLMTLPAFSSVIFSFLFKTEKILPPGFYPKEALEEDKLSKWQWAAIGFVFFISMGLAAAEMGKLFNVSWYYVVFGALIAGPMVFALGKVASETDINPVRLLAIALLFLFSIFDSHSPTALLAIGVCGATFAAVAVDLFYDLRTGYLVRANPKYQILVQFLAVIPASFVTVYFLNLLAEDFGFGEGKYFPAPGAVVWAAMAEAFAKGSGAISSQVWLAAGTATVLGVVLTLLENWKLSRKLAPSPFALGISLLLPIEMVTAIFFGSFLRFCFGAVAKREGKSRLEEAEATAFNIGSAIIAASSIAGIISVILIALGVAYLPSRL